VTTGCAPILPKRHQTAPPALTASNAASTVSRLYLYSLSGARASIPVLTPPPPPAGRGPPPHTHAGRPQARRSLALASLTGVLSVSLLVLLYSSQLVRLGVLTGGGGPGG
jgi:hypothetical protein